jgi:hypothetical protein
MRRRTLILLVFLTTFLFVPMWIMYQTMNIDSDNNTLIRKEVLETTFAVETCSNTVNRRAVFLGLPQSGISILNDMFSRCAECIESHPVDSSLIVDTPIGKVNELALKYEIDDSWDVRNKYDQHETNRDRKIPNWIQHGFQENHIPQSVLDAFQYQAEKLVRENNLLLADPRTSLLSKHWRSVLGDSHVCIHVLQSPLDFGESMQRYSHLGRVSLSEWSQIWEVYVRRSNVLCKDRPTVYISSSELVQDPVSTIRNALLNEMNAYDFRNLLLKSYWEEKVEEYRDRFVTSSSPLWRSRSTSLQGEDVYTYAHTHSKVKLNRAMSLYNALISNRNKCVLSPSLQSIPWKSFDYIGHEAYATIVTGDASTYVSGAVVNAIAISSEDSSRDMVALVTHQVSSRSRRLLRYYGWKVWDVEDFPEPWFGVNTRHCGKLTPDQKVRWGRMASKLRLWQLISYRSVLYMDCDAMVTGHVSTVFDM